MRLIWDSKRLSLLLHLLWLLSLVPLGLVIHAAQAKPKPKPTSSALKITQRQRSQQPNAG
nr:MAG TPA: hypothetical protein [Caudoviricetes sp.]